MLKWLTSIELEIRELEDGKQPEELVQPQDHVAGVMDESLQQLWQLARRYTELAEREQLECKHAGADTKEGHHIAHTRFTYYSEVLVKIFWVEIHERFELWGKHSIGIREGWKVVWSDESGSSLLDMLFKGL